MASVPDIQVDMFEVQLGAAILVQMMFQRRPIRVLADAGIVKSRAYPLDHVHKKLLKMMGSEKHLDLVIGTHYDEDHLEGLVPIIADTTMVITEVWLPPVVDDTLDDGDNLPLLTNRLRDDDDALSQYLRSRRNALKVLDELEQLPDLHPERWDELESFHSLMGEELASTDAPSEDFFNSVLSGLIGSNEVEHHCSGELLLDDLLDQQQKFPYYDSSAYGYAEAFLTSSSSVLKSIRRIRILLETQAIPRSFDSRFSDHIRLLKKAACKDAITACSLNRVIQALKKRPGILVKSPNVSPGVPKKFCWQPSLNLFRPGPANDPALPTLTLLGPSTSLIAKHSHRLPLGLGNLFTSFLTKSKLKSITASNQLSFVVRVSYLDQGILICGDAGFVDFRPSRYSDYYPDLLDALLPLHIVQVAHHGGNNAHFYRVLDEAGYSKQTQNTHLLLSHAVNDMHRPSKEFADFMNHLLVEGTPAWVLFTSEPEVLKVAGFRNQVHREVGTSSNVGDVQLDFQVNTGWQVVRHAIKV